MQKMTAFPFTSKMTFDERAGRSSTVASLRKCCAKC